MQIPLDSLRFSPQRMLALALTSARKAQSANRMNAHP
jgi:hypothetical protein